MIRTFAAVLLGSVVGVISAAEPTQISSKQELKAAVAGARTPADHERIAYYYRSQADEFKRKQAEEEQRAAQWANIYAGRTKTPNAYDSAMKLASYYKEEARKALDKADEHAKLARTGETPPAIKTP